MAAQRIEFIRAGTTDVLQAAFAIFLTEYEKDTNFVVTPIGFVFASDGDGEAEYVLAIRVEAMHKRTFAEKTDTNEAKPTG